MKAVISCHRKELRIHPFAWSTHWNVLFHTWKNQGLVANEYCSKIINNYYFIVTINYKVKNLIMYKEIVQTLPLPTSWCCFMAAFMQQVDGWWWGEGEGLGLEKASRGRNPSFLLYFYVLFYFLPSNLVLLATVSEPSGVGDCVEKWGSRKGWPREQWLQKPQNRSWTEESH